MKEDDTGQPTESEVYAASQPFADVPGSVSPFAASARSFIGVDAFNPSGPVPAQYPVSETKVEATCVDVHRSLSVYLDGELAAPQQNAVQAHLALCGPCKSAQAFQMQIRTTVATRAFDPMPEDVRERITRALGLE